MVAIFYGVQLILLKLKEMNINIQIKFNEVWPKLHIINIQTI